MEFLWQCGISSKSVCSHEISRLRELGQYIISSVARYMKPQQIQSLFLKCSSSAELLGSLLPHWWEFSSHHTSWFLSFATALLSSFQVNRHKDNDRSIVFFKEPKHRKDGRARCLKPWLYGILSSTVWITMHTWPSYHSQAWFINSNWKFTVLFISWTAAILEYWN